MIRHTVVFTWTPEATEEQTRQIRDELVKLPAIIPSIRSYACGPDLKITHGNADFAVCADFDDEAGFAAYRDDPRHREIIQRLITPITAHRTAVQFEL